MTPAPRVAALAALLAPAGLLAADVRDLDFERYDVNNDGFLAEMEWQDADFATVSFRAADTDNSGEVDREEAEAAVRRGQDENDPRDDR